MRKKFPRFLLIAGMGSLLLSGCAWLEDWPPSGSDSRAPYPEEVRVMQSGQGTWLAPTPAAPAGAVPVATAPVQGGPAATHPDVIARLNALEAEVAALKNDISMMAPALTRLSLMQRDLSDVLAAVQPAAGSAPVNDGYIPAPVTAYQQAAPQILKPLTPAQQRALVSAPAPDARPASVRPMGGAVETIRVGEHDDKTRIVLDITAEVPFSYDLDNNERLLVIDLPDAAWSTAAAQEISGSSLVSSFRAVPAGQGTQVAVQLNRPSEVIWAQTIPATGGRNPRIVIDLAR